MGCRTRALGGWSGRGRSMLVLLTVLSSVAVAHSAVPASADPSSAQPTFTTAREAYAAPFPMGHELGDLDGDNDLDVVVGGRTERAIVVFTNDGTGGLGPRSLFPTDQSVEVVRLGDLDGDGDLDAVVGGSLVDDDNGLSVLLGEGDGTFGPATEYPVLWPRAMALADLNGDDALDVVVGVTTGGVQVLFGNGDGTLGAATVVHGGTTTVLALTVGDLDGDDDQDIVFPSSGMRVLLGDGAGAFTPVATGLAVASNTRDVDVADLDSDGLLDVVYSYNNDIRTALGTGGGLFAPYLTTGSYTNPIPNLALADMNGDDVIDVIHHGPSFIRVRPGVGNGTWLFGAEVRNGAGFPVIGDMDGDGRNDIVGLNNTVVSVSNNTLGLQMAAPTATSTVDGTTVSWVPPSDIDEVTSYVVQAVGPGFHVPYVWPVSAGPGTTSVLVPSLINGEPYTFTVSAVAAFGSGPRSEHSAPSTPAILLGAPTIGTATPGHYSATVTWTPPTVDGGSPVTGYAITAYNGLVPVKVVTVPPSTSATIDDLHAGVQHRFRVRALNARGSSIHSSASNSVAPVVLPPGAPAIGPATAGDGAATVSWTAPTTGALGIHSYRVTPYIGLVALPTVTFGSTATTQVVTGLTNGQTYRFRVQAVSYAGTGPHSTASNPVTPAPAVPPIVPAAPTIGVATAGSGSATVTWSAPSSDGGSPILGYRVTPFIGYAAHPAITFMTTDLSQVISGLVSGTTYRFKVAAINANGVGPTSTASNAVTPTV